MTDIFPIIQPEAEAPETGELPLCEETAWDFDRGIPIFSGGRPLAVQGAEAVRVWCWKALKTARKRFDAYGWGFGCEVEDLAGKPFTVDVKESEAVRYVREALAVNPYVKEVRRAEVSFRDSTLTISCRIGTVYGEVDINV